MRMTYLQAYKEITLAAQEAENYEEFENMLHAIMFDTLPDYLQKHISQVMQEKVEALNALEENYEL